MQRGNLNVWRDEWNRFLENIESLFEETLRRQPPPLPRDEALEVLRRTTSVLRDMLSQEELEGIRRDVEEDAGPLLLDEIRLFNRAMDDDEPLRLQELLNLRLAQVQTIKDSVQELIENLPKRVKQILTFLDELLDLVKG